MNAPWQEAVRKELEKITALIGHHVGEAAELRERAMPERPPCKHCLGGEVLVQGEYYLCRRCGGTSESPDEDLRDPSAYAPLPAPTPEETDA